MVRSSIRLPTIVKLLVSLTFTLTICLAIITVREMRFSRDVRIGFKDILVLLYYIIGMGSILMHGWYIYMIVKRYYPDKEIPRSSFIAFHILSTFSWICFAGLLLAVTAVSYDVFISKPIDLRTMAKIILTLFSIAVLLIPFQLMLGYRLVSVIHKNHKKKLIESFN